MEMTIKSLSALALAGAFNLPSASAEATGDKYFNDVETPAVSTVPANGGMSQTPTLGKRRVVVVLGQWSNAENLDTQVIRQQIFSDDPRSLRSYVLAASDGKLILDELRVLTPDFGEKPSGNCTSGDFYGRAARAIEAAGIKNTDYEQLIVGARCQGAASAASPGKRMALFGQGNTSHVFLHEYGHNLGISHPRTYKNCRLVDQVVYAPEGCDLSGFSDSGDPVGDGSGLYPAIGRAYAGWLDNRQQAEITKSGIYKLGRLGGEGPQLYTLRRPGTNEYISLEHRRVIPPYDFPEGDNRSTGIWVRYSTVGETVTNIQLNANPADASFNTPTLQPGKELFDREAGIRLRVCPTAEQGRFFAVSLNNEPLPNCTARVDVPVISAPEINQEALITPVFAGSGIPGATVRIVLPTKTHETLVDAQGHWRFVANEQMPEGNHTFKVSQRLDATLYSAESPARGFRVKHSPLSSPQVTAPLPGAEVGRYPIVSGHSAPGAMVSVGKSFSGELLGRTSADEKGQWSVSITEPLPPGNYSISTRQTLGRVTSQWGDNVRLNVSNTLAPPVIEQPQASARFELSNVVFSGQAQPGAKVRIVPASKPEVHLANATTDAMGRWEVRVVWGLSVGAHAISAKSFHDGMSSEWTANRRFTVEAGVAEPSAAKD